MTINLHTWSVGSGPDNCRSLSSDENSFCEAESGGEDEAVSVDRQGPGWTRRNSRAPLPSSSSSSSAAAELPSSGYASIHRCSTSTSSSPACSFSPLVPCAVRDLPVGGAADAASATPGFRLLVPALQRTGMGSPSSSSSSSSSSSCKQVKRKNGAAHSGGEMKSEEEEEEEAAVAMEEEDGGKARLQDL